MSYLYVAERNKWWSLVHRGVLTEREATDRMALEAFYALALMGFKGAVAGHLDAALHGARLLRG